MKPFDLLVKAERTLATTGLVVASVALVASLVMVVIGVAGRYVLKVGVTFVDEYAGYALVVMAFMALSSTLTAEKHIRITSALSLLPKKARHWLDLLTAIITLVVSGFVCLQSWERAMMSYRVGTVSVSPIETPLFLPQLFIPLGFALLCISLVLYICRAAVTALKS